MAKETDQRPPQGVEPREIWLQLRAIDLANAINRYVSAGFVGGEYVKTIRRWTGELVDILYILEDLEEDGQ